MTRNGSRNPLTLLAVLLILSPWPWGAVACAAPPEPENIGNVETAIRAVWTALDERWNARDADGFSDLFSQEARFGFVDRGESLDGRGEIHRSFSERFPTFAPELRHRTTVQEIRSLSPRVAVLDGGVEILRVGAEEGADPAVILRFAIFAVMHRTEEEWQIRELRVFELPLSDGVLPAVQSYLDTLHANGSFPGVSAGIALPDGSVLHLASGVADEATGAPLSADSRFLGGSVGKTFFAALAMELVREGRLGLDTPISHFLGDEPWFDQLPNARDITVRMLMNHTSGLVRYEFDPGVAEAITSDPDKVWTGEERLGYLFDTEPPFAAGEDWTYSDTNYIVLAMIMERITGTEAYSEIRHRFIDPLGLRNTVPSDRREIEGLIQGYAGPDNPFGGRELMVERGLLIFNPQLEWAGGGYASSPSDLAIWARAHFSGRALGADLHAELVDGVATTNPNLRYGLGTMIGSTPLGPSWGHGGFFPGYLTEMRYYPDHDLGVVVQFNTSVPSELGSTPGDIAHEVARLVIEHAAAPAG